MADFNVLPRRRSSIRRFAYVLLAFSGHGSDLVHAVGSTNNSVQQLNKSVVRREFRRGALRVDHTGKLVRLDARSAARRQSRLQLSGFATPGRSRTSQSLQQYGIRNGSESALREALPFAKVHHGKYALVVVAVLLAGGILACSYYYPATVTAFHAAAASVIANDVGEPTEKQETKGRHTVMRSDTAMTCMTGASDSDNPDYPGEFDVNVELNTRYKQLVTFAGRRLKEWESRGMDISAGHSLRVQSLMKALSEQTYEEYFQCNDFHTLKARVKKNELKLVVDGLRTDLQEKKTSFLALSDPGADADIKRSKYVVKPRIVRVLRIVRLKITALTAGGEQVLVSRDTGSSETLMKTPRLPRRGPQGCQLVVMKVPIDQTDKRYIMQQSLNKVLNLDTDWQYRNLVNIHCHNVDLEIAPPLEGEDVPCWVLLYNFDVRIRDDASPDDVARLGLPDGKDFHTEVFEGSAFFTSMTTWGWLPDEQAGPDVAAGGVAVKQGKSGAQARLEEARYQMRVEKMMNQDTTTARKARAYHTCSHEPSSAVQHDDSEEFFPDMSMMGEPHTMGFTRTI